MADGSRLEAAPGRDIREAFLMEGEAAVRRRPSR
jgi:hypothetical protein